MSTRIEMPELSSDGEGATLATWLVAVGDHVEKGDVIAELETDKSTVELEAPESGTISRFDVAEGEEDIPPGTLLALLDADAAAPVAQPPAAPESSAEPEPPETQHPIPPPEAEAPPAAPVEAAPRAEPATHLRDSTPLARRAAQDHGVDLSSVTGSGPRGRVVAQDVLRSADSTAAAKPAAEASTAEGPEGFRTVRLSAMRKTIARRMTEAKQRVPHFYLRIRCTMDAVLEARAELNRELESAGRDVRISVNDFVVRAAALALRDVPEANVSFAESELRVFDRVDVCVAVATDGGLVTPVVREADRKGLATLAEEVKELAVLAREGKLRPEQYQGGSFTISNLGMYGIETVYPILNPPQACILGVGAAEEEAVVRDGAVGVGRRAAFTLAADHRAVDGAVGARFLAALREKLEDPLSMLF